MKHKFTLILMFSFTSLVFNEVNSKCKSESKTIDSLIEGLFLFGSETRRFPTNPDQLKKFCNEILTIIDRTVKPHIELCFDKLAKRLSNLILYSVNKNNGNTCRSRRRRAELLEFADCGNAGKKGTVRCWQRWLRQINGLKLVTDSRLVLPLSCCITHKLRTCFQTSYERQRNRCSDKSIDNLLNFFDGYITDSMSLICGDFTADSDKCDKILPKLPKAPKNETTGSPVTLMVTIFNKLPDVF